MKQIFYSPLIHPFIFSIYPVLYTFSGNIKALQYTVLLVPILVILLICGLTFFLLNRLFKNLIKASFLTSYIIYFGLSYKNIIDFLETNDFFLFIFIFIGIILGYVLKKSKNNLVNIVPIVNVIAIALIIFPITDIVKFQISYLSQTGIDYRVTHDFKDVVKSSKPDIYYLIFDRYAGVDTLEEVYNYDNFPFLDELKKRGFYVANQSRANYISTELSLSSSLNLVYLDDLIQKIGSESGSLQPLHEYMENNSVVRFLKTQGYSYIHLGSWWAPTSLNRYADRNINILSLSEFSESIFNRSILFPIASRLEIPIFNNRFNNWKRIVYQFNELRLIPEDANPNFVFGHFLLPHPPYVFDADGNYLPEKEIEFRNEKINYINQLKYTNDQILKIIDVILAETSGYQPIIIIQADEGPYPIRYEKSTQKFDWSTATDKERLEKMQILNAYYLPGIEEDLLYQTVSPVNTFRIVLNEYFNQSFPLLSDISYYSNKGKPYWFTYMNGQKNGSE